jgi:tRNA(adenine34) deaminase
LHSLPHSSTLRDVYCRLHLGQNHGIVYGATRNHVRSMYFDTKHINTADLIFDAFRNDITVEAGLLSQECATFYYRPGDNPPAEEQLNK